MQYFLVKWSLSPAYGDPEGIELIQANNQEEAVSKALILARSISRHGKFYSECYTNPELERVYVSLSKLSKSDLIISKYLIDYIIKNKG